MRLLSLIQFTFLSIIIIDSFRLINSMGGDINLPYASYISTLLIYISIGIFVRIATIDGFGVNNIPELIQNLIKFWLFWNFFNLLRGAFLASDYWDWKELMFSAFSFSFVPLVFFLGKNITITQVIFNMVFKYLFLFGFAFIPLSLVTNEELYSRLMIPVSLFILFIPYIKFKWKILVMIVAAVSILMVIEFRSNIIKIVISSLLFISYYFRKFIGEAWLRLAQLIMFAVPIILFSLAISGKYNVFEESAREEGYEMLNRQGLEESLMVDTRTFLYVEVMSSLDQTQDWVIGKSAIGSYQSDWFTDDGGAMNGKRTSSEVGILNILMRFGIIGIIIYFLILYSVSQYAIRKSTNYLSKMLGLFIAFRWTYSFVEEYTVFDLNFYFFWLAIGLVSSNRFRKMTDVEVRNYFEII